ncbi:Alpha-amylase-related protein-like Protein [Tribolium castaneum]|uniref:Alpha-amylase n=1 Tax=Tribolium castaneum TaxID=7070 RepID=A0A139WMH9_TRICA|nr:Alpha-amylase-related protein-like Protein [Tribolium castaneum]
MRKPQFVLLTIVVSLWLVQGQKKPNFAANRSVIVHLNEWKWADIGDECERYLQYGSFGGVQISPVAENVIVKGRPWWERYQPVSYNLTTRSGSESQLSDMISRCNKVGIRIYADVIFNHMAALTGIGTAGNKAMSDVKIYPGVPYTPEDFHPTCNIPNYLDPEVVRNCELNNLRDLDQSTQNVQLRIVTYLNKLIGLGVAGFRVDSAKYIATEQLEEIYSKLNDLNTSFFPPKTRSFIYQDVPVFDNDVIGNEGYAKLGNVLESRFSLAISRVFSGKDNLTNLQNWGPDWGFIPTNDSDSDENVKSPIIYTDGSCGNGFVCEHRWPQVRNMVDFRNAVSGTEIGNWWSNNEQQIAFSRGSVGFIAFANGGNLTEKIQTGLAAGTYCDIISGSLVNKTCTGKSVVVDGKGVASIRILESDFEGVVAVFVNSKK